MVLPTLRYEIPLWQAGYRTVAGLDEVGRGAWAGPVVTAAVILPRDLSEHLLHHLAGVRDSKQMTPLARTRLAPVIQRVALDWAIGATAAAEIDRVGIVAATQQAMHQALNALTLSSDALLLDAFPLPGATQFQQAILHGDALSLSIAAASVLAKVQRDTLMHKLDADYPQYGFARHKGYGTVAHRAAIGQHGLCALHRKSWQLWSNEQDASSSRRNPHAILA